MPVAHLCIGRDAEHPPPSSAEVKERVRLYRYYTSEPSWPILVEIYLYLWSYTLHFSATLVQPGDDLFKKSRNM